MENKKSLIAIALVALVGIVGVTFAYFTSTATLNNPFQTGTYSTSVKETFISPDNWTPGTTTQKKVNVTNNGSVDIAVRATYTEQWTAKDGTKLDGVRNGERVALFTIGADWDEGKDGYYYYKDILGEDETSTDFISSVTFNPNFILQEGTDIECTTTKVNGKTTIDCVNLETGYAGATYSLNITIETIQSDKKWTYVSANAYEVGDVITIGNETFNVIKDNGSTVTMLASFNLGTDYKQSQTYNGQNFSNNNGWGQAGDLDIQLYDGPVKTYVNNYVTYLQGETGDSTLTGTLITMSQLEDLGCDTSSCLSSQHAEWLATRNYGWWTRTAEDGSYIWNLHNGVNFDYEEYGIIRGIRPVITISKTILKNL